MDASTALLILAAIVPYLIWLIKFIMKQANFHVHHGNVTNEELSKDDSSASSSDPVACPPYPLTTTNDNTEELSMFESDASSSGGQPPSTKYDVFLSFREDTRDKFTSHLHQALRDAGINTYIDYRLNKGEMIGPSLEKAIEDSHIYVIIFSKNYASSTWCLDELVKIIECKERDDARIILPVFYHVEPSNVRKQSGTYADAFLKHERRFNDSKDKVQRWRDALSQIPDLCGWHSDNIRPESKLVQEVVKNISKQLICISSCESEGLVGIEKHVKEMEKRLSIGSPDVRIVGIWGMGGIGKTTIAKAVFHRLKSGFESYSFVAKVREQIEKNKPEKVQKRCLSELLKDEDLDIYSLKSTSVKNRLGRKKILLVLDDVDNLIPIDDLIKATRSLGVGSRIIITSRDKQVIKDAGAEDQETYYVREMNYHDALQLFSLKAFKKNQPSKNYLELSERMINYCKSIPLALIVLGSFLFERSIKHWENALEKLEKAPHEDIFNVLKISFDGLDNPQKHIFLDLSCFFSKSGGNMPKRSDMRNYYEPSPDLDIEVLIERSLISVDAYGRIVMHDLVVAMGQEISTQQLANNPDKPIRLWKPKDVYRALTQAKGTETIRSISINISKTKKLCLHPATFWMMDDLRFLEFYKSDCQKPSKVYVPKGLENLPDELRILYWEEYPLPTLPSSFDAVNLVELIMQGSHLERLWDGDLFLPNLKRLNLKGSKHLVELPDLSLICNIEKLYLDDCESLVRLYSSSSLAKLKALKLSYCSNLASVEFVLMNCKDVSWHRCRLQLLPPGILSKNLVTLSMPNSNLKYLWHGDQHLPNLKEIWLAASKKLIALPDLCQAPNIETLTLFDCPNLVEVYSSIFLDKLCSIDLGGCCHQLSSLHLARKIPMRSSVLLVSLSICILSNTPVLRSKAVSSAELQLFEERMASSLPNLNRFNWLSFDVHSFVDRKLQDGFSNNLWRKSLEPEKELRLKKDAQYPCLKYTTIKVAHRNSFMDSSVFRPSSSNGFNRVSDFGPGFDGLFEIPNYNGLDGRVCTLKDPTDNGHGSPIITHLSLQISDTVSLDVSISGVPGFPSNQRTRPTATIRLCDSAAGMAGLNISLAKIPKLMF